MQGMTFRFNRDPVMSTMQPVKPEEVQRNRWRYDLVLSPGAFAEEMSD